MKPSTRRSAIFLLLLVSSYAWAQIPAGFVNVTATVPQLANGSFIADWTNLSGLSQLPLLGGVSAFQTQVFGNFDSNGKISILLADTAQILPTPSTWTFSLSGLCAGSTNFGYKVAVAVTGGGGAEDISAPLITAFPTNPCQGGGGGGAASHPPLNSVQVSNGSGGLNSDPNILANPTTHILQTPELLVPGAGTGTITIQGATSSNGVTQTVNPSTAPWTFTWPAAAPAANGFCLVGNTSGTATWTLCGGGGTGQAQIIFSSQLASTINSGVTTIPLSASTAALAAPGVVIIDQEWIFYTGVSGDSLTGATRGYHQTTAAGHNSGTYADTVLMDFGNPSQAPQSFIVSSAGGTLTEAVFGCATPNTPDNIVFQANCNSNLFTISALDGTISQASGVGNNRLQSETGIGPGGGEAPITNSGYLFDSTRQNQSRVPQGFGAGLAGPVESVQPSTIGAPSVINFAGTGSTIWSYECTGTDVDGHTYPGTVASITNGPTTITGGEIIVTCPFSAGASTESIYRTAGGPNQGLLITTPGPDPAELPDGGGVATVGTPPSTNASVPKVCVGTGETSCWISSAGAPSGACVTGWLYTNTTGGAGTTFYVCESSAWVGK